MKLEIVFYNPGLDDFKNLLNTSIYIYISVIFKAVDWSTDRFSTMHESTYLLLYLLVSGRKKIAKNVS